MAIKLTETEEELAKLKSLIIKKNIASKEIEALINRINKSLDSVDDFIHPEAPNSGAITYRLKYIKTELIVLMELLK